MSTNGGIARSDIMADEPPSRTNEEAVTRLLSEILVFVLDDRRNGSEDLTRHLVLALREHVIRTYGRARDSRPPRGALAPWQLRRAQDYMSTHLNEDICVGHVAAQCDLSVNHFVRAFRESVGTTPHRWLMSQRLAAAMALMRDARNSIAEIAGTCGFADQSHFTRVFSARFGMPPGQWRRVCLETVSATTTETAGTRPDD
ncbi:helix-turn-helix domain-containing protein [Burkholderia pyrrocinia]|uniref:helix-turn-helix domain-containing protein n=1 Tax=Burkholderia pyrrocinia TaxID=60550 RepID=UPI0011E4E060|nr:AraC family transcriptional regulator [Burkholderia pyrrocinia]